MASIGFVTGIAGGLVATIVMTVFMMALGDDSPPPTAALWSKYVGDGPAEDYMMQGMALHMLYGIVAGVVFALGIVAVGLTGSLLTVVGSGIVYGIILMMVGAGFWMKVVLGMDPDKQTAMMFGLFHLVYGIVLGLFVQFVPLG